MRYIQKQSEPNDFRKWRLQYKKDPNFGYGLIQSDLRAIIVASLMQEQGWLCAYTGRRIRANSCHIEHLVPQAHCKTGQDVEYNNIVACYPAPNTGEALYGAHQKKDWPAPAERHLFISPLEANCANHFDFSYIGKIKPTADTDTAAVKTIQQLKLDHSQLTALRRAAIQGTLQPKGAWLKKDQAQRRLAKLQATTSGELEEFCFALIKALDNHIKQFP